MKKLLLITIMLLSTATYAQSSQLCEESGSEIRTYLLGSGQMVPMFDQSCFEDNQQYVKDALEAFAQNIDSSLITIQSLEQSAKLKKNQYLNTINEIKLNIASDLASSNLTTAKKNQYKYALANIGQDIAIGMRMVGNDLFTASAYGRLLGQFLPYLENENEFIQRSLGYNSVEEVAQLRDLLVAFDINLSKNVMEAELAFAQYEIVNQQIRKLFEIDLK